MQDLMPSKPAAKRGSKAKADARPAVVLPPDDDEPFVPPAAILKRYVSGSHCVDVCSAGLDCITAIALQNKLCSLPLPAADCQPHSDIQCVIATGGKLVSNMQWPWTPVLSIRILCC